uniref:Uncharacterized protein n=1 Tax=Arundo donax TaxID=35708 RepID=A0A0A9CWP9_ARUDO
MRRPFAAAALRLRLRLPSSSPPRLLSCSPIFLFSHRDDDDDARQGPSSAPPPLPPPLSSPFSPRPLLTSASGVAGLRGWWRRALPPTASRPPGAVADAPPVRLTISRSYSLRVAKGKKKAHFDDEHRLFPFFPFLFQKNITYPATVVNAI